MQPISWNILRELWFRKISCTVLWSSFFIIIFVTAILMYCWEKRALVVAKLKDLHQLDLNTWFLSSATSSQSLNTHMAILPALHMLFPASVRKVAVLDLHRFENLTSMEFLTLSRLFMYSEDTESGAHLAVQGQSERSTLCSGTSTVSKMLRLAHEYIYLYVYICLHSIRIIAILWWHPAL